MRQPQPSTRIIWSALAILVPTAVAFFFSDNILALLILPSGGLQLKAFSLMDGFLIKWRVSLMTGVVIAFPVWAYQLYDYIRPGLFEHERRAIVWPLLGAAVLFVLGGLFGYYMLWGMIRVLINFGRGQYGTALVFVAVTALVAIALALYGLVSLIERRLLAWKS